MIVVVILIANWAVAGLFLKLASLYLFQSELLTCSYCLEVKQITYRSLFLTKLWASHLNLCSLQHEIWNSLVYLSPVSALAHATPHLHADRIKSWFSQRHPQMNCDKGEARSSFRHPLFMGLKHKVTQMIQLMVSCPPFTGSLDKSLQPRYTLFSPKEIPEVLSLCICHSSLGACGEGVDISWAAPEHMNLGL